MKDKTKYFLIPFVLMIILNLGSHLFIQNSNFGAQLNPHLGILFTSGLFFGPYGIIGAVLANFICDLINGYTLTLSVLSEIMSFLIAYLAFKLWYSLKKNQTTSVRLNSTQNMLSFFLIVFLCGMIYAIISTKLVSIAYPNTLGLNYVTGIRYFINFVNFSLLISIIMIWLSRIRDFAYVPESYGENYDSKVYQSLLIIIVISTILILAVDLMVNTDTLVDIIETLFLMILIGLYIRKPVKKVQTMSYVSIPEKIMDMFLALILVVVIIGILSLIIPYENYISMLENISPHDSYLLMLTSLDLQILIIFIPSYFIVRYIEAKVVKPLLSFSKIESRILEDQKIEVNDLINVYSQYSDQTDEIGMLSRSYINLVNYNNNYIENLTKVENEKQRIKTELDIAYKIQKSILPTHPIENDYYFVTGFSRPAKEVGGDFFDYYELDDENLVIVIGDSSGKGVPAAIFSTIIQNSIQQHTIHQKDPAEILSEINNQICKKNTEFMFITLWLGIYNRNTHRLVFSNGGHNPPMVKKDGRFVEMECDSNVVLGLQEDFPYTKEETVLNEALFLYTDGITDARNDKKELYGENRLLNILNNEKFNEKNIELLLDNLDRYIGDEDQFDDITFTYLKILK